MRLFFVSVFKIATGIEAASFCGAF